MITIRKSSDRGHFDHGWLDTRHTFSFAAYHDPAHMGFHSLRVINQDRVRPARGFAEHGHDNMEIISYIVDGRLAHRDSAGHESIIGPGGVQVMSAGTGVTHSEYNASTDEPVHFLQIWILPERRNVTPAYADRQFDDSGDGDGPLHLLVSHDGRDDSLAIHQDADLYRLRLSAGDEITRDLRPGRAAWLQLIQGELEVNGESLEPGDGAAIENESAIRIEAKSDIEALLFDLA